MARGLRRVEWPDIEVLGAAPDAVARVRRLEVRERSGFDQGGDRGDLEIEVMSCGPWGALSQEVRIPLTRTLARDLALQLLPLLSDEDRQRVAAAAWVAVRGR